MNEFGPGFLVGILAAAVIAAGVLVTIILHKWHMKIEQQFTDMNRRVYANKGAIDDLKEKNVNIEAIRKGFAEQSQS